MTQEFLELSKKIVLVVEDKHLEETKDGFFLDTKLLKDRRVHVDYTFDVEEELANAHSAFSLGSGFFIAPNIIATAAHVLLEATRYKSRTIENIRFINCFCQHLMDELCNNDQKKVLIPHGNIYKPLLGQEELVFFEYTARSQDWAFLPVATLDGVTAANPYFEISYDKVEGGDKVSWYGHPLGLPIAYNKNNENLTVIRSDANHVFEIVDHALAGLSGAPALKDGKVVGIVARGMGQFDLDRENQSVQVVSPTLGESEGSECQRLETLDHRIDEVMQKFPSDSPIV